MKNYGERLRAARKRNGLTQTELAERLGITQKSYQRMETGIHDIKMSTIQLLCRTLDISADWLMGLNTEMVKVEVVPGKKPVKTEKDSITLEPKATKKFND